MASNRSKILNYSIPNDLNVRLINEAKKKNVPKASIITIALSEYLDRKEFENKPFLLTEP